MSAEAAVRGRASSPRTDVLDVAVVGAGPFGLSVAAHLAPHRRVRLFGHPMRTWRELMPPDMLLRSDWDHTNLSAPGEAGTLTRWVEATGSPRREPIPIGDFLAYADWFRRRFAPDVDEQDVAEVDRHPEGGFALRTVDGGEARADEVVLAVGVTPFPTVPAAFRDVDDERVSFAIAHQDFSRMRGQRVVVVGGGQNGLESAAQSVAAGAASVEVVVRSAVRWFTPRESYTPRGPLAERLHRLAYPIVGFGPPPLNRIVFHPDLFALMPAPWRARLNRRILRSGGSPWVRERIDGVVPVTGGVEVVGVEPRPDAVALRLDTGEIREADRVVIAAGYRFDLDRLSLLSPALRRAVATEDGRPVLDRGFRSSVPGLLFVGYAAEHRFGPLSRYVEGTAFAAPRVAEALGVAARR